MNALIHMWSLWDRIYYNCTRLEYIDRQEKNIFRVKLFTYRGETLYLNDGTIIHHNDTVLKIHLHNCLLMREMREIENNVKRALYVQKRVLGSLPGLAQFIAEHPQRDEIKGILGITLLTRGVKPMGFDVKEISNIYYRRMKELILIPMYFLCNPNVNTQGRKKEMFLPKYVIMSRDQLLKRYL